MCALFSTLFILSPFLLSLASKVKSVKVGSFTNARSVSFLSHEHQESACSSLVQRSKEEMILATQRKLIHEAGACGADSAGAARHWSLPAAASLIEAWSLVQGYCCQCNNGEKRFSASGDCEKHCRKRDGLADMFESRKSTCLVLDGRSYNNGSPQGKNPDGTVDVHIAALGAWDDDEQRVWVGLNIPHIEFLGECVKPPCVSMCFCDNGAFLNIRHLPYKITSIMQNGKSLCMGKCPMSEKLAQDLAMGAGEYSVQIEQLPNAPIRLRTVDNPPPSDKSVYGGTVNYHVLFTPGDLGLIVPGWICVNCRDGMTPESPIPAPLSLWVTDVNVGCIHGIQTSFDQVDSIHRTSFQPAPPKYRTVTLMDNHKGKSDTFMLPFEVPDETKCLAKRVMDYLRGGDAVIQVCPGGGTEDVTPAQLRSASGGPNIKIQANIKLGESQEGSSQSPASIRFNSGNYGESNEYSQYGGSNDHTQYGEKDHTQYGGSNEYSQYGGSNDHTQYGGSNDDEGDEDDEDWGAINDFVEDLAGGDEGKGGGGGGGRKKDEKDYTQYGEKDAYLSSDSQYDQYGGTVPGSGQTGESEYDFGEFAWPSHLRT